MAVSFESLRGSTTTPRSDLESDDDYYLFGREVTHEGTTGQWWVVEECSERLLGRL